MTRKTDPPDVNYSVEELHRDYIDNGLAEHVIAHRFGVSRAVVGRWLREAGIPRRGTAEAGLVRAAKLTPEERAAQASAAHAAAKGRVHSWHERCLMAYSRMLNPPVPSRHEQTFMDALQEAGVPYRREVAIGAYNIDVAIGPVAVEILGGEWHLSKTERHGERTPYILDQGWALAFVWAATNCPLEPAAAHEVIAWANQVSRNPSMLGEYRVVRGDGYLIASGRCQDGKFPGIPPARRSYDPAA